MEYIVASNVAQHLNKHNMLYGLRHAFCKKRSCETQLLEPVEELCRKVSNCHQVDLALLDFSKAFDIVSNLKLLFILSTHGIKGKTLKWIGSFLGGRTQAVALDEECSPKVSDTSCKPQGFVLGPFLFLFYTNDLPEIIQSQVRLFLQMILQYTLLLTIKLTVKPSDLVTIQTWERTWNTEFSPNKCQVLHISRANEPIQYPLPVYPA